MIVHKRQKLEAKDEAEQDATMANDVMDFGDFPALPPGLQIQAPQVIETTRLSLRILGQNYLS